MDFARRGELSMDRWRFDDLSRLVATRTSRRTAGAGILGALLARADLEVATAKRKHRHKRRRHQHHQHQHGPTCRGIFWACRKNSDCCAGTVCGGTFSPEESACQVACTSDADCFAATGSQDVSCESFALACAGPCCVRKDCLSSADCQDSGQCCGDPSLCCFPGEKCTSSGCVPI